MRWFALVAVFAVAGSLIGQDKTQPTAEKQTFALQLKGKEGDEYFIHSRVKQVIDWLSCGKTRIEQEFIWHIKVEKVTEDGNIHSKWKALLLKSKHDHSASDRGYFDSEKGEAKNIPHDEVAWFNELIEKGVKVETTKTGKVVSGAVNGIPSLEFLPEKPVKVGDSWMVEQSGGSQQQVKMVFRCTLKEVKVADGNKMAVIELELLKLKVNLPIEGKIDAKGKGTILFNIDKGMAIKHNLMVRLTFSITNQRTGEVVKTVTDIKENSEVLKEKPKCNPKKAKPITDDGADAPSPAPKKKLKPQKYK